MQITLRIENVDTLPTGGPVSFTVRDRGFDIGRHEHLDWCLPDPQRLVSGKHCEIRFSRDQFILKDVSTNGTYVNGSPQRLEKPYALKNGDRLLIGNYWIAVSIQDHVSERGSSFDLSPQTEFPLGGYPPATEPFPLGPFVAASPPAQAFPAPGLPAGMHPSSPFTSNSSPFSPMAPGPFPEDAYPPSVRGRNVPPWPDYSAGPNHLDAPHGRHAPPSLAPGIGTPVDDVWNRQGHAWGVSDPSTYDLEITQPYPGSGTPLRADPLDHLIEQPVLNRNTAPPPAAAVASMQFASDPFAGATNEKASSAGAEHLPFASATAAETRAPSPAAAAIPSPGSMPSADLPGSVAPFSSAPPLPNPVGPGDKFVLSEQAAPVASSFRHQQDVAASPSGDFSPVFDGRTFLKAFARGAKIPETALDGKDPEVFAEQIGEILNLVTGDLMGMLQARSQIKAATRNANLTLIGRTGNNALKFSPTATMALQTMLASDGGEGGYLPLNEAMPAGFKDVKKHHIWTYAAMQKAVVRLEAKLSPDAVEADTPSVAKRPFSNPKAQLWDKLQERWKLLPSSGDGGLLGLFTQYFTECYEELSRDDPETSDR